MLVTWWVGLTTGSRVPELSLFLVTAGLADAVLMGRGVNVSGVSEGRARDRLEDVDHVLLL